MATYFDRREGKEKTVPDCGRFGLVWDPQAQRCETGPAWSLRPCNGLSNDCRAEGLPGYLAVGALLLLFMKFGEKHGR